MIIKCQLGYIGHLARYDSSRIEKSIFGCVLEESSTADRRMTTSRQYWHRICAVIAKQTDIPEKDWLKKWMEVAQNAPLWHKLSQKVVEDNRAKHNSDTWALRHSAEREAERAEVEVRGTTAQTREAKCKKCGCWISLRGHLVHVRACDGTPYVAPTRPECPYCSKPYSALEAHMERCPLRPGAPQAKKMSRKETRQAEVQITVERARQGLQPGTFVVPAADWKREQTCSRPCPYCKQLHASTPSGKTTPTLCRSAPFSHWLGYSLFRRDNYPKTTEIERKEWTFRCHSCGHTWKSMKAMATHRTGCNERRLGSNVAVPLSVV